MKVRHILPYHARESSHWKTTDSLIHVSFTLPTPRDDKRTTWDVLFVLIAEITRLGSLKRRRPAADGNAERDQTEQREGCVLDGSADRVQKEKTILLKTNQTGSDIRGR